MSVLVEKNVECTLRDGVRLRANVYRPVDGGPYPVILTRMPYGKDTSFIYTMLDPVRLAEAGYIVVVQDVRGRFRSEGEFSPFHQEFADGYDSVEWASKLPGSNGDVGMFGASYLAFAQWAAAASGHPALKAIAPAIAFDDEQDIGIRNGALEWGMGASWYLGAMAPNELARKKGSEPQFPMQFFRLIEDYNQLTKNGYYELPLADFSPLKNAGILPYFRELLRADPANTEWEPASIKSAYNRLNVSVFLIGGWYDIFLKYVLNSFQQLRELGRQPRLLIGPWTHTQWGNYIGELDFGMAANSQFLDLRHDTTVLHQRWFDAELKGLDNGLASEPPIKFFVMGENRWRSATEWPLPNTVFTKFYLHSDGHANRGDGDGTLSAAAPAAAETPDTYVYNPANPVPTVGGNTLMTPSLPPGPRNQARIEQCDDVLVYTSDPLQEDTEVIGPITAHLWVSSSAPDTDFVVRLVDVHPDGTSINLADGVIRMRYRNGLHSPSLLQPGEIYPVDIDCWATSNVFKRGHRIRVHVTSSSFPRWSRNLNTGQSNETTAEYVEAEQTIYHDAEHPSHIVLPLIPRA